MEMRSSAFQGEITSPGFGGEHDYRDQLNCSYTVEVPENLKEMIGTNGVLVIQLLVDTKEKEEYITINRGPSFLNRKHPYETWEGADQVRQDDSWIVPASTRFKRLLLSFWSCSSNPWFSKTSR